MSDLKRGLSPNYPADLRPGAGIAIDRLRGLSVRVRLNYKDVLLASTAPLQGRILVQDPLTDTYFALDYRSLPSSLPGPAGPSGGPGPVGPAGRSLTGLSVDGNGHFIATYSDGTTADIGAPPTTTVSAANISDASPNGRSLITASNYAAMKALLAITTADISDAFTKLLRFDAAQTLSDAAIAQALANLGLGSLAFCGGRLDYVSGTQIVLKPALGSHIWINGAFRRIPAAGVTLANTGLLAFSDYYIYARWSGTAVFLEGSPTAPVDDTNFGHRVKGGDASQTLVGGVAMASGGVFSDTSTFRGVASYYNRRSKLFQVPTTSNATTTSTSSYAALGSASTIYTFGDDDIQAVGAGSATNSANLNYVATSLMIDGAAQGLISAMHVITGGYALPVAPTFAGTLSAGRHTVNVGGQVGGNTGTFNYGAVGLVRQ